MPNRKLIIKGQKPLNGTINIHGSKNAALPIIAATLLSKEVSVLTNVPHISDVLTFIHILEFLGAKTDFNNDRLVIDPQNLENKEIPHELVSKMRASIILLAPLLHRFSEVKLSFPGGCVLGKRPIDSHLQAFTNLGVDVLEANDLIHLKINKLQSNKFAMNEMSVTATENALMLACITPGESIIKMCAAEPHIQDLCLALNKSGANISGIGTHSLKIQGTDTINGLNHHITSDYLEIGTYAIAAAITKGHLIINNAQEDHLDAFWQKMKEVGVKFKHSNNQVEIFPSKDLSSTNIRTAVFPSFPTDLQAQFAVLLTQCKGKGKVFETLFDGKMNYIFELEKMGAQVEMINIHQAIIFGPSELKGCPVASLDIRAGAAMVLAGLCAKGETEISNINYIYRGYSHLVEKLQSLGAEIYVSN